MLTPIYIKIIGIESFAIIAVTFSIQAIFLYFDMGFGTATTIETANHLAQRREKELGHLLRTAEVAYWAIAIILWGIFVLASKLVQALWLSQVPIDRFDLGLVIPLMGGVIMGLWPSLFYNGALLGLQRPNALNGINLFVAVAKGVFTLIALLLISPTVEAFLIVNLATSLLQSICPAVLLRRWFKVSYLGSRFDFGSILPVAKKSFKFSALGFLSILFCHVDKMILSRILPLTEFGYYSFSWMLIYGMYGFCGILTTFYSSRFSYLNAVGDEKQLVEEYHHGCQWMSVLTIPATLFFLFFSPQILSYWYRDPIMAESTFIISSLLVAGACLFSLCYIPQAFQVAKSLPGLIVKMQSVGILAWVVLLVFFVKQFGIVGAGIAWLVLQFCYLVIYIALMHRQLLMGEKKKWILDDVIKPTIGALIVCILCRLALSSFIHGIGGFILLMMSAIATFASSAFMVKSIRLKFLKIFQSRYNVYRT